MFEKDGSGGAKPRVLEDYWLQGKENMKFLIGSDCFSEKLEETFRENLTVHKVKPWSSCWSIKLYKSSFFVQDTRSEKNAQKRNTTKH